ncbi:hypothetical protein Ga0080574_TMP3912 [Salipiger abyssi]|uniref:Uncharacterized protein n=1 Tax=Salipiger abyssi TaxID=1250539 RepID=A0A1P8UY12_9RHOB|nr:hypothetical protein Ga0080574_TMP3912 [Salipiger abyssi]
MDGRQGPARRRRPGLSRSTRSPAIPNTGRRWADLLTVASLGKRRSCFRNFLSVAPARNKAKPPRHRRAAPRAGDLPTSAYRCEVLRIWPG